MRLPTGAAVDTNTLLLPSPVSRASQPLAQGRSTSLPCRCGISPPSKRSCRALPSSARGRSTLLPSARDYGTLQPSPQGRSASPMAAVVCCYVPCREAVPRHRPREAAVPRCRRCTSTAFMRSRWFFGGPPQYYILFSHLKTLHADKAG